MVVTGADAHRVEGISNVVVAVLLHTVAATGGDAARQAVPAAAGDPRTLEELTDPAGWSTADQVLALFRAAAEVVGDPDIARHAGQRAFSTVPASPVPGLLRTLGEPAGALAFVADHFDMRSTVSELSCEALGERSAVVGLRAGPSARPDRMMCQYVAGVLSALPVVFDRPPAVVTERCCQLDGHDRCEFEVSWEPARPAVVGDPTTADGSVTEGGPGPARAALDGLIRLTTDLPVVADPATVAGQLADVTPAVGGCRRAVVLLWHEEEDRLVETARTGRRATVGPAAPGVAACGGFVDRVVRQGRPLSLRARSTEPVVADICRLCGFADGLLVPMVAHGSCYGVLAVDGPPGRGDDALLGLAAAAAAGLARLALREQARRQAMHDPLTGLPDSQMLRVHAEPVLGQARRGAATGGLLVVDLDGLAAVNDAFGRGAGDRVLVAVAGRLRSLVREGDTVARVGDDEFAVLLPMAGTEQQVVAVAERMAAACEVPVAVVGGQVTLTVSIGVARCTADDTMDTLLGRADRAMYGAKAEGPGRVRTAA